MNSSQMKYGGISSKIIINYNNINNIKYYYLIILNNSLMIV